MANEIQIVTLSAAPQHGSFKLTFEAEETGSIAYDADAAAIQAALEALSTIGSGNVSVTVDGLVITIEFAGALASTDVSAVSVTANTLGRNTVETLSLDGIPASGAVGVRKTGIGAFGNIEYNHSAATAETTLEGAGYPASLSVSGASIESFTLTTPEDVTLELNGAGTFQDTEENPLTLTYTKTQAYSAVTATPSTQQNGSDGGSPSSRSYLMLLGVG